MNPVVGRWYLVRSSSGSGSVYESKVVAIDGGQVVLDGGNGALFEVPISHLISEKPQANVVQQLNSPVADGSSFTMCECIVLLAAILTIAWISRKGTQ